MLLCLLLLPFSRGYSQLTLEACQEKARENYPLVKQYDLLEKSREYTLANAGKGYLPQLSLSAKATYQSEVARLPVSLPGVEIKPLNKDQYQVVAELNQLIWDGGMIRARKRTLQAESEIEYHRTDVELYAIRERVNQLFFGALLAEEQLKVNGLLQRELQQYDKQVFAYVQNGVASAADLDAVRVELLQVKQQEEEVRAMRRAYRLMLAVMIGEEMDEALALEKPVATGVHETTAGRRPEIQLFDQQERDFALRQDLLTAKNRPRIALFAQGGYGNPGLNMLKNEFAGYYIAGARLSWNFGNLYTLRNERKQLALGQQLLQTRKEAFLFHTRLEMTREQVEVDKWRRLLAQDDEVVLLRERIRVAAEAKVKEGTLGVLDLMREVNRVDQARQAKTLHEIQLLMAIYNIGYIVNSEP